MADFSALKTSIQNYIKQNGNEEITGNLLQQILLSMVSTLGDSAINDLVTALNAEIANRGNADTELGGRITTLQGVVNGIVANVENGYVYAGIATPSATPVSGKVFYLALTAGTYTNFGATVVPQGINILKYNGSAWSLDSFLGLDDAPTQGSGHLVKSGGVLDSIIKDGSAFDLSAYNSGATYADLSAALTALNALPAAYKIGGMSFKYVQTSDNKYVQYRYMSSSTAINDFINVANWQGVDTEITAGSKNIAESGAVVESIEKGASFLINNVIDTDITNIISKGVVYSIGNGKRSTNPSYDCVVLKCSPKVNYSIENLGKAYLLSFYNGTPSADTFMNGYSKGVAETTFKTPNNCKYFAISWSAEELYNSSIIISSRNFRQQDNLTALNSEIGSLYKDDSIRPIIDSITKNLVYRVSDGEVIANVEYDSALLSLNGETQIAFINYNTTDSLTYVFYNGSPSASSFAGGGSTTSGALIQVPAGAVYVAVSMYKDYGQDYGTIFVKDTSAYTNQETITLNKKAISNISSKVGYISLYDKAERNVVYSINNGSKSIRNTYDTAVLNCKGGKTYEIVGISSAYLVNFYSAEPSSQSWLGYLSLTGSVSPYRLITPDNCTYVTISVQKSAGSVVDFTSIYLHIVEYGINELIKGVYKEKPLTKIFFCGDSLFANEVGGAIPSEYAEESTEMPMRLRTNNVVRRMYDALSYNKPIWKRLDNPDWILSGFTAMNYSTQLKPWMQGSSTEKYYEANTAGSYCQITVPKGYKNFALIVRKAADAGVINITINNSTPGTYLNPYWDSRVNTNTVITSDVVPQYISIAPSTVNLNLPNSGTMGDIYHIIEFHNLDSSRSNIIKITTNDNGHNCIWGGFYWNGNTLICIDGAIGGNDYNDQLSKKLFENCILSENYDYVVCEAMLMNIQRSGSSSAQQQISALINTLKEQNVVFTSCNPWGISIVHDTNFADLSNPTLWDLNDMLKQAVVDNSVAFIDVFTMFKRLIESRGGTLSGGEGGLWYTWDGQHPNEDGCKEWFDYMFRKWISMHN